MASPVMLAVRLIVVVTSVNGVLFLPLSVCQQDNSKLYSLILMNLFRRSGICDWQQTLDFGSDPDYDADTGI